ncbi:chemotaxis protein CheD [Orenia marismortui]|uniref:Probable chemoreceptor glutamine deamidase CheD n=2 Tax=Orenia marismortui TaxID=46469 RepID=A0A4R8H9R4_9FIRM|nr:chemotaxis protein CheD [Orenia marismortui]
MADLKVGNKDDIIITSGLGSCVGLTLYDNKSQIGGMAHIMLPECPSNRKQGKPEKYADTAIEILIDKLQKKGANTRGLEAKMAGGAQMFNFSNSNDRIRIGDRNIEAVEKILRSKNIPIIGAEVRENYGRTMELYNDTGKVIIKTVKHDNIVL